MLFPAVANGRYSFLFGHFTNCREGRATGVRTTAIQEKGRVVMSIIKVSGLAYCRLRVPDLDKAEQFLVDFGLIPTTREQGRRYLRATDPSPYCYVIEEGPAHFLGFAFHAKSRADLETLARRMNRPIEAIAAPGGGSRVRLKEPNGYDVDVVFGIEAASPIEIQRQVQNTGAQPLQRAGELFRLKRGQPTPVKRLAHVVMGSPVARATTDWFQETLGTISSDEIVAGPNKTFIGSFMRVDDGDEYVDHHAIFIVATPIVGLQHISFEVPDVDAVMADHHYLKGLGRYEHMWGVGRHLLGSQIFDYWSDPFGYFHEHWADSDRLNASTPTNIWDASDSMITQWGEDTPEHFKKVRP
jgi:catechol 2,3-dioxygenase-like lactoylglutathione lyase family enzyme